MTPYDTDGATAEQRPNNDDGACSKTTDNRGRAVRVSMETKRGEDRATVMPPFRYFALSPLGAV